MDKVLLTVTLEFVAKHSPLWLRLTKKWEVPEREINNVPDDAVQVSDDLFVQILDDGNRQVLLAALAKNRIIVHSDEEDKTLASSSTRVSTEELLSACHQCGITTFLLIAAGMKLPIKEFEENILPFIRYNVPGQRADIGARIPPAHFGDFFNKKEDWAVQEGGAEKRERQVCIFFVFCGKEFCHFLWGFKLNLTHIYLFQPPIMFCTFLSIFFPEKLLHVEIKE